MRTLTTDALASVNTAKGTKPLILVEVQWVASGAIYKYADKDIGAYKGQLLNVGTMDDVVKITGGSASGQVALVLNDTDGQLKTIIDTHDIHKRPCWVYQLFEGLATTDKILLMRGEISSPVVWDEGAQQLNFDVITRIESTEIGFSIEEGQFPLLPIDLVGKAWPLAFGSVVNVPALRITSPREGTLADGFGIHDYTLRRRIQLANALCCPPNSIIGYNTAFGLNPTNATANVNPNTGHGSDISSTFGTGGVIPQGNVTLPDTTPNANGSVVNGTSSGTGTGVSSVPIYGPDPNCVKNRCDTVAQLNFDLVQQKAFEFPTIRIYNGPQFVQNTPIVLAIGGAYVHGSFNGEIFTVTQYVHGDAVTNKTFSGPPTQPQLDFVLGQDANRKAVLTGFGSENPADHTAAFLMLENRTPGEVSGNCVDGVFTDITDCQSLSMKSLSDYHAANFQWVNAGAKVTYAYDEEIVYVANIIPSTVKCVTAYRTLDDGRRILLVVPSDYYTIRTTNYTTYNAVEIVFNKALSLQGIGWEDVIYVSLDSSVGPNTVDILEWLITTYTTFGIDATSFAAVETLIDNYPSHFALLQRKNILQALDEISFQARCALHLRDNTFYIKYLPITPTTVDTITEDHVTQNTLKLTSTTTEELVTKFVVTWNDNYAIAPKLLILRNNINKYGTHEQQFDFYIYDRYQLVEKSALFWLIRKSNTWRKATFTTPLVKLPLETFDDVLINLPDICDGSIPAEIESATIDPTNNSISFDIWLSSVAGTRVKYPWAYSASTTPDQLWPPDLAAQGIGFGVIAPVGHPLSSTSFPVGVPDDQTAPNFVITNCTGPVAPNLNFCCQPATQAQPSEFCQPQGARRTDDANDVKPGARTTGNCPGAVNLSKDPVFALEQPKFKAIQRVANAAHQLAASAQAKALNAGGGAGGGGGANNQDEKQQKKHTDTFDKLPKKKSNPPAVDPAKTATCVTTITISWFPINGTISGGLHICVPAGPTRTETHTFGGCIDSNKADGSIGAARQMMELLAAKGMDATTFEICSGGYDNSPCCHVTVQVISPNCAACDPGANDGQWMNVVKNGQGGTPKEYSSAFEDGNMGDRGQLGQTDSALGIDAA